MFRVITFNFVSAYYVLVSLYFIGVGAYDQLEYLSTLCLLNLIGSLLLLYRNRMSPFMAPFFFFVAFVLYSIFVGRYVYPDRYPINSVIDYSVDYVGQVIFLLFNGTFSFLKISPYQLFRRQKIERGLSGHLAVFLSLVGLALMFLFSDTSLDGRAGYSPLYEYSIVFFIFSLYFAMHGNRIVLFFVLFVLIFAISRDFYIGHRATGFQISLAIYALIFSRYYTFFRLSLVAFFAILISNGVSVYRVDFESDFVSILNGLINNSFEGYFTSDTAIFAYVASLSFIAVRDMIDFATMVVYLIDFITGIFVSGRYGDTLYSISLGYFAHSNGGILPFYLYFYLGFVAAPMAALIVAAYLRISLASANLVSVLVFLYVFATIPRWLLYSPSQLFRGVLLVIVAAVLVILFVRLVVGVFPSNPSKLTVSSG